MRTFSSTSASAAKPIPDAEEGDAFGNRLSQEERHFHGKAFISSAKGAMVDLADYHTSIKSPLQLSVEADGEGVVPGTSVALHVSGGNTPTVAFQLKYDRDSIREAIKDEKEGDASSHEQTPSEESNMMGYINFTSPVGGAYQYEPHVVSKGGAEFVEWKSTKDAHNLEGLLVRDLTRFTYGTLTMKPRPR